MVTTDEFAIIVKALKAVYPAENFIPDMDAFQVWYSMLSDLTYTQLHIAVQIFIQSSNKIPTVADLRALIAKSESDTLPNEMEAWAKVRNAVNKGWYYSEEEFNNFPDEIKKAVGQHTNLKQWSQLPTETLESVIQSQFLRTYRSIVNRQTQQMALPENERTPLKIEEQRTKDAPLLEEHKESAEPTKGEQAIAEVMRRLKEKRYGRET